MTSKELFLKPNVLIEPLINQWYAWPLLVTPHTYAMILTNLHLKIMQSYLQSPVMHANAVKNPKMIGGPFIDLEGNQTAIVKELMERTTEQNQDLLAFAEAVKTLEGMLQNEAKGNTLLPLYDRLPEELKGYVELGYDLNNNPSIRFIERLLYRSSYYKRGSQAIRLSIADQDHRSFALSTPRFPDARNIHYQMPFDSEAIDRLFSMKHTPRPLEFVADFMPEDAEQRAFFTSLFTETPPELRCRDRGSLAAGQVRVKYFGHAVLLIETSDVSVMTDPVVSYTVDDNTVPRFTYEDLPEVIDYVFLTHNHQDHILFETLLPLRHRIRNIIVPRSNGGTLQDPSVRLVLENCGFKNIIELDEMESLPLPGGAITSLPFFGEHGDLHIRSKSAMHLKLHGKSLVCAADSNNLVPTMYDMINEILGPTDMIFLGMECAGAPMSWLYGPLLSKPLERRQDQSRRLDGSDADKGVAMIESLNCNRAFVYAMGMEPWLTFVSSIKYTDTSKPIVESNQLIEQCRARGMVSERLFGKKEIFV